MPYLIGVLLALTISLGARMIGLDRDRAFYPLLVGVVAQYYVLFAVMSGAPGAITIEVAVGTLFVVALVLGFRGNLWWAVAGLAAHGLLDSVHAHLIVNSGVPAWWPAFCGSYDITAAAVLGTLLSAGNGRKIAAVSEASERKPVGVVAAVAVLTGLSAQGATAQVDSQFHARNAFSLTFVQTRPVGALGGNIGQGYGLNGSFIVPLDRRGLLSVRADIGVAEYGSDVKRTAFSESVGDRVQVKVRTINAVVPASLGLQLSLPSGPVFTYLTAGLGGQAFYTESQVEPTSGGTALASTVNQSDVAPAWTVGGGIYVPLRLATSRLLLDIGAQYVGGGRAKYLAPGSISDLPGGQISFTPMESSTHLVVLRFGVRMGL